MIYDRSILICTKPAGTLIQSALVPAFERFCGFRTVYASRFWNSVQAGSSIDRLAELPRLPGETIEAEMYAVVDGAVYRINQAQEDEDRHNRPIWRLSLKREERSYDIALPEEDNDDGS